MGMWEVYQNSFDGGIPFAAEISSIFIVALCAFGLWKAYKIFKEI
jgi:hypothetical protein